MLELSVLYKRDLGRETFLFGEKKFSFSSLGCVIKPCHYLWPKLAIKISVHKRHILCESKEIDYPKFYLHFLLQYERYHVEYEKDIRFKDNM